MIITDTDHLWGHGGTCSWAWKGFLRGLNPIFMDPWGPDLRGGDGSAGGQAPGELDAMAVRNRLHELGGSPPLTVDRVV